MSLADKIFVDMCKDILENGTSTEGEKVRPHWEDGTSAYTIKKFGVVNRYDLSKEFPALTLRRTGIKSCVDEMLWIWQKKSNNIHDLNSHIWDSWADEDGSIGKAYGYQMQVKHQYKEGMMDQVDRVIYDLKNNPYSRRIMTNIYVHQDLHEMNLYPCAYSMTFNVTKEKDSDKLTLNGILNQRSQDVLAANNWNVCQYAVLLHMLRDGRAVNALEGAFQRRCIHQKLARQRLDRDALGKMLREIGVHAADDLLLRGLKVHGLLRAGDLHDALDDLVQQTALLRVCRAVVDLLAVAAADEQAALRQGAQMVRHGRAGHLQHGGQIDDAGLLMAEQPENAHARALLRLPEEEDRLAVLQTVIRQQLNVAKTEAYIDAYLAKKNAQDPPKRGIRKLIVRDVRLFLNSVNHSLELVRSAGIQAETKQEETDREIVLTIRLPKRAG